MTKDEALRLALEAMKINNKAWKLLADSGDAGNWEAEEQGYYQLNEQAIKAIKEALETKDEPMAWEQFYPDIGKPQIAFNTGRVEYVAPRRKPLTLGQKQRLWSSVGDKLTLKDRVNAYGFAIEAAHGIIKDKNNG